MKHFNAIVSIISFVENIERTISCTVKISVSLPVPELPATQRLVHRPRPGGPTGPSYFLDVSILQMTSNLHFYALEEKNDDLTGIYPEACLYRAFRE